MVFSADPSTSSFKRRGLEIQNENSSVACEAGKKTSVQIHWKDKKLSALSDRTNSSVVNTCHLYSTVTSMPPRKKAALSADENKEPQLDGQACSKNSKCRSSARRALTEQNVPEEKVAVRSTKDSKGKKCEALQTVDGCQTLGKRTTRSTKKAEEVLDIPLEPAGSRGDSSEAKAFLKSRDDVSKPAPAKGDPADSAIATKERGNDLKIRDELQDTYEVSAPNTAEGRKTSAKQSGTGLVRGDPSYASSLVRRGRSQKNITGIADVSDSEFSVKEGSSKDSPLRRSRRNMEGKGISSINSLEPKPEKKSKSSLKEKGNAILNKQSEASDKAKNMTKRRGRSATKKDVTSNDDQPHPSKICKVGKENCETEEKSLSPTPNSQSVSGKIKPVLPFIFFGKRAVPKVEVQVKPKRKAEPTSDAVNAESAKLKDSVTAGPVYNNARMSDVHCDPADLYDFKFNEDEEPIKKPKRKPQKKTVKTKKPVWDKSQKTQLMKWPRVKDQHENPKVCEKACTATSKTVPELMVDECLPNAPEAQLKPATGSTSRSKYPVSEAVNKLGENVNSSDYLTVPKFLPGQSRCRVTNSQFGSSSVPPSNRLSVVYSPTSPGLPPSNRSSVVYSPTVMSTPIRTQPLTKTSCMEPRLSDTSAAASLPSGSGGIPLSPGIVSSPLRLTSRGVAQSLGTVSSPLPSGSRGVVQSSGTVSSPLPSASRGVAFSPGPVSLPSTSRGVAQSLGTVSSPLPSGSRGVVQSSGTVSSPLPSASRGVAFSPGPVSLPSTSRGVALSPGAVSSPSTSRGVALSPGAVSSPLPSTCKGVAQPRAAMSPLASTSSRTLSPAQQDSSAALSDDASGLFDDIPANSKFSLPSRMFGTRRGTVFTPQRGTYSVKRNIPQFSPEKEPGQPKMSTVKFSVAPPCREGVTSKQSVPSGTGSSTSCKPLEEPTIENYFGFDEEEEGTVNVVPSARYPTQVASRRVLFFPQDRLPKRSIKEVQALLLGHKRLSSLTPPEPSSTSSNSTQPQTSTPKIVVTATTTSCSSTPSVPVITSSHATASAPVVVSTPTPVTPTPVPLFDEDQLDESAPSPFLRPARKSYERPRPRKRIIYGDCIQSDNEEEEDHTSENNDTRKEQRTLGSKKENKTYKKKKKLVQTTLLNTWANQLASHFSEVDEVALFVE